MFALSFFVYFLSRRRMLKTVAAVFMGFGLLFFGLELIRIGTEDLGTFEVVHTFIKSLSENPVYAVLLTAFMTGVACSSTVTISLAMTLAAHGLLSLHDSVYWIFGANIGTTATALIAAAGGNYVGRQVAWAHTFYKIASVLLFFPVANQLTSWLATGAVTHDVANINTFYNVIAALVFYPFIKKGAEVVQKLFPPSKSEREYAVKYLSKSDWQSPSVSLAHAERESLRMADVVTSMIEDSLTMFRTDNPDLIEKMRRRDDRVDLLARELNLYLAHQLDQAPEGTRKQMLRLMYFITDLEAAADVVDNQLIELAQKKHNLHVNFSAEGWRDLEEISSAVLQISQMSIACFESEDKDLAAKVIFHKRNIRRLEQKMRESHITRLVKGTPESIMTSSIHLDVLGEYRRIVGLISNHVYGLLKDADPYGLLPRRE
jgi:phosphate:Na+ symporter